jgi:DNA-binding NarL/FixJ family response regulator
MREHELALLPQPWDWPGPRVLLEQPYETDTRARVDALRRAGYAVSICPGPTAVERCPLAGDEGCAAAHGADVVVSGLGLETAEAREALAALRVRLPRLPVLVEAEADAAAHWPQLLSTDDLLKPGISPDALVDRVHAALERKRKARA